MLRRLLSGCGDRPHGDTTAMLPRPLTTCDRRQQAGTQREGSRSGHGGRPTTNPTATAATPTPTGIGLASPPCASFPSSTPTLAHSGVRPTQSPAHCTGQTSPVYTDGSDRPAFKSRWANSDTSMEPTSWQPLCTLPRSVGQAGDMVLRPSRRTRSARRSELGGRPPRCNPSVRRVFNSPRFPSGYARAPRLQAAAHTVKGGPPAHPMRVRVPPCPLTRPETLWRGSHVATRYATTHQATNAFVIVKGETVEGVVWTTPTQTNSEKRTMKKT